MLVQCIVFLLVPYDKTVKIEIIINVSRQQAVAFMCLINI